MIWTADGMDEDTVFGIPYRVEVILIFYIIPVLRWAAKEVGSHPGEQLSYSAC